VYGVKVDLDNAGLRYLCFQQLGEVDGADLRHVAAAVDVASAVN
jgi:hypothetical protein